VVRDDDMVLLRSLSLRYTATDGLTKIR